MTTHISNQAGDSPAASTDTNAKETRRQQSPWPAVEVSKLREALAEVAKATKPSSPAIDFGRYVRREVDLAPDSAAGVLAMGKFLRLDPVGKAIEKLETADGILDDRIAKLESHECNPNDSRPSASAPRTKSRRGRKRREAGLDCTAQMLNVLIEDETAAVLTGRAWERRLRERFGPDNGFGRRTVEKTILFQELRAALESAMRGYGPSFEEDVAAHGLEIWTYKPGRGDKRKDLSEKQSVAARNFLAAVDFAKIEAKRRVESRHQAAAAGSGQ